MAHSLTEYKGVGAMMRQRSKAQRASWGSRRARGSGGGRHSARKEEKRRRERKWLTRGRAAIDLESKEKEGACGMGLTPPIIYCILQ